MNQLFCLHQCQLISNICQGRISYLLSNDLRYASIAVSQSVDSDTRGKVKISPVLDVPHVTSFSLFEHWWRANISRDHVWQLLID